MSLRKSTLLSALVAAACVVVMLVVTITNTQGLARSVDQRTQNYLHDVARQSSQVVRERFVGLINSLEIIGNSLAFSTVVSDEEFLRTKLVLTEFDALAYVRPAGGAVMVDREGHVTVNDSAAAGHGGSAAFQDALEGKTTAAVHDGYVAFIEPIASESEPDEVRGVMIGVRTLSSLQNLLVNGAFGGSGLTLIIDQYDEVLANPDEAGDSEAFPALLSDSLKQIAQEHGVEVCSEIGSGVESTIETPDGQTMLLEYEPLDIFGWGVVTAVDEDFLAQAVNEYLMRIMTTVVLLMAVLIGASFLIVMMQRRYQKRVEEIAFVDPITNGMSFIRFRMLARPLVEKHARGEYALVTLNVKQFKLVNRLGGSLEGDSLLRQIYDVIQRNVHEDELAAHNSADTFVMLLKNEGEKRLGERLGDIARQVEALRSVMPIRVTEGAYVMSDPDIDMIMFLDRSNIARSGQKKEDGSTVFFYDDEFVRDQEEHLAMVGMIADGMRKGEFTVYLQPKVSPETGEIGGSEALVRWIHPERGMIGPNVFIPLCEQHGLVCDLDLYVFRMVCSQIEEWHKKGWEPKTISVNVSGLHLRNLDFVKEYRRIADEHHVDPGLLELEITESIMFSDIGTLAARTAIDKIHEHGFRCSMDDFGSGYSALGLLSELPVDWIKLDRSFFVDRLDNMRALMVVCSMIALAHDLGIRTVAEGIETRDQVEMLRALGCDLIQGFYYSRPMPMDEFARLVFEEKKVFKDPED